MNGASSVARRNETDHAAFPSVSVSLSRSEAAPPRRRRINSMTPAVFALSRNRLGSAAGRAPGIKNPVVPLAVFSLRALPPLLRDE